MLHFIDCVLVPYVQPTKQTLGFDKDHFSLALFDVFAAHRCERVLQALKNITPNTALYHLIARESFSHWILQSIKCSKGTKIIFHQVVCWTGQGPVERWSAAVG
jgi:hypothetical protein